MSTEAMADLVAGMDAVLTAEPTSWSEPQLREAVLALERVSRCCLAVQARCVAEAAARGVPSRTGCKDGAGWLRSLVNLTPAEARTRVEVAEALLPAAGREIDPDLQPARAALLTGGISTEHARVLCETATRLSPPAVPSGALDPRTRTELLDFLAGQAQRFDVRQVRTLARRAAVVVDPAGDERLARDEVLQAEYRGMTLSPTRAGLVQLHGMLTPECAGLLATAIDAGSARRPAADGTPDPRSAAMRRHDSLQQVLHNVVAADGVLPSTHGAATRLLVTVPFDTFERAVCGQAAAGADPATLPGGWPVSTRELHRMSCTGEIIPVLLDAVGQPLDVGDTQYLFPPRIRTALIARDGGCTWPGCEAPPSWCDAHHLRPFSAGGPISIANGALLCGRHHRHVHATGYVGHLRDGTVVWAQAPPSGPGPGPDDMTLARQLLDHLTQRVVARSSEQR